MADSLTITRVHAIAPYVLDVQFSEGTRKFVDIEALLWGPVFQPVRYSAEFRRAYLDDVLGTVAWPCGADIAPEAIYALPEAELASG